MTAAMRVRILFSPLRRYLVRSAAAATAARFLIRGRQQLLALAGPWLEGDSDGGTHQAKLPGDGGVSGRMTPTLQVADRKCGPSS